MITATKESGQRIRTDLARLLENNPSLPLEIAATITVAEYWIDRACARLPSTDAANADRDRRAAKARCVNKPQPTPRPPQNRKPKAQK
jgi:hypothetical protein